jgi:glycosyltransferase involved in cell wall biosynthesis
VHESLIRYRYTYFPEATHEFQGIAHFCPSLNTPWRPIHNGFAIDYFHALQGGKRPLSFICVAAIDGERRFRVKGMDSLLHLAHRFPQCSFAVVGVANEARQLFGELPKNLTIYPFLDKAVFRKLLSAARFYLQLSISEGFPNALCEAMLSECVPIGSRVGGIPFIIGDTGFVMDHHAPGYQEKMLEEIITSDEGRLEYLGKQARARVRQEFPMEARSAALFDVLENGGGAGQRNDYICPV